MPRAMVEMRHQLPLATLIPYPVVSERAKSEPWWSNPESLRLLMGEYIKYLLALTRMNIDYDNT
jgi:hypothetical protein